MEVQNLEQSLFAILRNKSSDSTAYRKALTIYQSVIESTHTVPGLRTNFADSDSKFALFLFGSIYKILLKDDQSMKNNLESILLLINQTLPYLNITAIKTNNLLNNLQTKIFAILNSQQTEQKTPLMIRYAISILSYTLINIDNIEQDKQSTKILCEMFNMAVSSHRTNTLSRQSSKMLTHLVQNNQRISVILSRHASMNMLAKLQSHLYLNNVREVIALFPIKQINDIGYRVSKYISTIDIDSQAQEIYLLQIYFFLEKLMPKFSTSTLQEICKQLINNVPSSAQSDNKIFFCYLQALHASLESLVSMNEHTANKFVASVVSILQEFIVKGGRIQKQSYGIMKSLMSNCVRKSLWIGRQGNQNQQLAMFEIENLEIEGNKSHNFGKLVCMLQAMLSDQYKNTRAVSGVIIAFFQSLDSSAFNYTVEFIDRIIQYRDNFDDRHFKSIMHAIFGAMSMKAICEIYPMSIKGNIADANFQSQNNLWLAHCAEKFEGDEDFQTYTKYFYPILQEIQGLINNPNITYIRKQAYKSLKVIYWRCLKVFCRQPNANYSYDEIINTIKQEIPVATDSILDHIAQALENLCEGLAKYDYQFEWAGNLISMLAKTLKIENNNSKQILRAIKYLSLVSVKEYLNRVFDKNIVKLLQEKQKGTLNKDENINVNLKNLEILISVSSGIDFTNPMVVAPYRISREELVIKLIQGLIAEKNNYQKKSYKYIVEVFPRMGTSFRTQVIDLLDAHQHVILPASKHYRMSILTILWRQMDDDNLHEKFGFIKTYLPQIMISMREPNQRTRKQSNYIFDTFCDNLNSLGLLSNFIEMMCAGLATDSVQMKVATLNALANIFTKKYDIELQFSLGILEIVLMLLYEKQKDIFKAIIEYCRRYIFSIEKNQQSRQILKTMMDHLFKADEVSRLQYRCYFKHFLLKLVKRFTREIVDQAIPSQSRKMLSNAIKTENREKRKKKEKQIERRAQIQRLRNQKKEAQESSDQNHQEQNEGDMDIEQKDQLQELNNEDNLLLKYDLDQQNFHFEEQKLNIRENFKKLRKQQKQADDITFGENGLMIIKEQKRQRQQKTTQPENGEEQNPASQAYLNVKKRRKLNDIHTIKESGETYRPQRAGGDIKHKDKPQPYAFIQFNSKALNKRFKKRAEKAFETIFQKHQGGLKGIKSKIASRH